MTLFGGRIPDEDSVIPFPQKQYNDYVMVPGLGAQRLPPAADNDNAAADGGYYIGLDRREGDWMQTYTGRQYWPCDPRSNEVHLIDIAHALSLMCRYAGHCIQHYSVAEHSVHMARWLLRQYGPTVAMYGLLHDATEAYCVDVPRPLKPHLANYSEIEERNWLAIAYRFGLPFQIPNEVHDADNRIIADELVNMQPMPWHAHYNRPLGVKIQCWSPIVAETEFLATFQALDVARNAA